MSAKDRYIVLFRVCQMSSMQSAIIYQHLEGEEGVFVPLNSACRPGGRENPKSNFNMVKKK